MIAELIRKRSGGIEQRITTLDHVSARAFDGFLDEAMREEPRGAILPPRYFGFFHRTGQRFVVQSLFNPNRLVLESLISTNPSHGEYRLAYGQQDGCPVPQITLFPRGAYIGVLPEPLRKVVGEVPDTNKGVKPDELSVLESASGNTLITTISLNRSDSYRPLKINPRELEERGWKLVELGTKAEILARREKETFVPLDKHSDILAAD